MTACTVSNVGNLNQLPTAVPQATNSPVSNSKDLTIEAIKTLAEKGNNLTLKDFEVYKGIDVGSGLYIMQYPVNSDYYLLAGFLGPSLTEKPIYVYLEKRGTKDKIDIRTGDIEKFIRVD